MAQKSNPQDIQNYLSGVNYPARRDELVNAAERNNAPDDVMRQLREMPDQRFEQPTEVQEILRQRTGGGQQGRQAGGGGGQPGRR